MGIWPQGTSLAGSAGCVYVCMCISVLVCLLRERTEVGSGEVRFMLTSVFLVRGYVA